MQHAPHTLSLETILISTKEKMQLLVELLKLESSVFKKNDIEELESITLKKISLTEQLEKNELQRVQYLTTQSFNPNEPTQWLSNNKLISTWSEIKTLSEQAQKQNQINGMVIYGNRRRVQTQIEILNAATPAGELTYSASGENISQRQSNTLAHV